MTNLIDTQLGQYRLVEVVRRGGMSIVYKAYQASLDRFVAVKVLSSNRDPQFAARFKREARASATLQHHNILQIYDYGEQDDLLYLTMQYVENGMTLADMLDQPLDPVTALRLMSHVLDALDYAHKRGVIHRDIKPANVLMPTPNWPMLADFGIAKLLNDTREQLTMVNQIIGTAAYMSPEQATGRTIDVRTDLYAVGVVLYELLTGRVPFEADTPIAVASKHVYEIPPPPRSLNPDLPPAADAILTRALAKNPAARYQSAAEMAAALVSLAEQIDRGGSRSQVTSLYEAGVHAFEEGHWDVAVERLGKLAELNPEYEDVTELLAVAHEEQERARTEARQRIDQVRQRRQSTMQQPIQPPAERDAPTDTLPPQARDAAPETSGDEDEQTPPIDNSSELLATIASINVPESAPAVQPTSHTNTSPATVRLTVEERAAEPITAAEPVSVDPRVASLPPVADFETLVQPGESANPLRRQRTQRIIGGAGLIALLVALFILRPWEGLGAGSGQAGSAPTEGAISGNNPNPTVALVGVASTSRATPVVPTAAPHSTVAPTVASMPDPVGKLVYEDAFNAGANTSGLEDLTGATDFQRGFHDPGVYHFKILQPNTAHWEIFPRHLYRHFNMQLELWDNSDTFSGDVAQGLIFRVRDINHFYAVLIDPRNRQYTVRKQDGENTSITLMDWQLSPLIKQQADHNVLRIDGDADTFTIYLNGTLLASFNDDSYNSGMLGMIVANADANTPHMHFDNLKVWSNDVAPASSLAAERKDPHGDMVLIPGGEFIIGSNEKADEFPNVVKLDDFYIDRAEVTNALYAQCVTAKQCTAQQASASKTHTTYTTDPKFATYPVIEVSWQQANAFCTWAGKRLPTEAEWEKAASWNAATGEKMVWPWGNTFDPARLNSAEGNAGDTVATGQFPPELNNTVDMGGNVYEWTSSLAQPYPYNAADGREDPQGGGERIFRGGSWAQTQGKARTFSRQSAAPTFSGRETGFRCASGANNSGQGLDKHQDAAGDGMTAWLPSNAIPALSQFLLSMLVFTKLSFGHSSTYT